MMDSMLKAVSQMLAGSKEEKVQCAKIIVDELIKSYREPFLQDPIVIRAVEEPKKPKKPVEPKWEAVVKDGKLIEIKDFPEDGRVKINGVEMSYKEAKGKPFQTIDIL